MHPTDFGGPGHNDLLGSRAVLENVRHKFTAWVDIGVIWYTKRVQQSGAEQSGEERCHRLV